MVLKMNKVAQIAFKLLRMTPDDVIVELHSHKMGLTNSEADRRYEQHGPNALYHPGANSC